MFTCLEIKKHTSTMGYRRSDIRKYFKLNENGKYQDLWDMTKTVYKKNTALNTYIRKV